MPIQLCSNEEFREKICGAGGKYKSLVDVNRKPYGIPQGTPISDMLANVYLIDFDIALKSYCSSRGGIYYRYSDDILMLLPGSEREGSDAQKFTTNEIKKYGSKMLIKDAKTAIVVYESAGSQQTYRAIAGRQGRNGLEYLGFRYDGCEIWIRNSTLSRLYRKVSGSVAAECANLVGRYRGKSSAFMLERFEYGRFFQRYGRVEDFEFDDDYNSWTFWTYARKAMKVFGRAGRPIPHQLRNYKMVVRKRVQREIVKRLTV
jgi:hypothetical protein